MHRRISVAVLIIFLSACSDTSTQTVTTKPLDFLAVTDHTEYLSVAVQAAQDNYRPGEFTTFIAYEWSPMPGGAHMHRNVIFRGSEYPERPFTAIDSLLPEDLSSYAESNDADLSGSYIRPALMRGLELEQQTGTNPFIFGLI